MKYVKGIIAAIVIMLGLAWVIQGNEFLLYRYFAPKSEAVRRQVFEQTKSYNQGMIEELQNMHFEYVLAGESQRAALASIILHRTADYDDEQLPADLRLFVQGLRKDRQ